MQEENSENFFTWRFRRVGRCHLRAL